MADALNTQLLKELDRRFGEQGFIRSSDRFYGHRYDRATPDGRQSIALAFHMRQRALVLDPAFASVRLDEEEREVFQFEQKSELVNEHDALQRGTVGKRLDKFELLKTASGRYAIATPDDCQTAGEKYPTEMLKEAERFWEIVPTPEAILARLTDVPGEASKYAGTDFFAATRAIVLTRMIHGEAQARLFADRVLSRFSGNPRLELSQWMMRAFDAWGSVDCGNRCG